MVYTRKKPRIFDLMKPLPPTLLQKHKSTPRPTAKKKPTKGSKNPVHTRGQETNLQLTGTTTHTVESLRALFCKLDFNAVFNNFPGLDDDDDDDNSVVLPPTVEMILEPNLADGSLNSPFVVMVEDIMDVDDEKMHSIVIPSSPVEGPLLVVVEPIKEPTEATEEPVGLSRGRSSERGSPFPQTSVGGYKKRSRGYSQRQRPESTVSENEREPKIVIVISDDEEGGGDIRANGDAGALAVPLVWRGMNAVATSITEQDTIDRVTVSNFSLRLVYNNAGVGGSRGHVNCFITRGGKSELVPIWSLDNGRNPRYVQLRREAENPLHDRKTRDKFNDEAAALIFDLNNRGRHWTEIDLHGLRVREARKILSEYIGVIGRIPAPERPEFLTVIVGKGIHSIGGIPVLPSAIQEFCRESGKRFWAPPGEGHMIIDMKTEGVGGSVSMAQMVPKPYIPQKPLSPVQQVGPKPLWSTVALGHR